MNDKISENGNIDFEKMENSTPNLPFGPKIVGQNSTSGDMPRSEPRRNTGSPCNGGEGTKKIQNFE
mgnify:CR=1 FL=1